MELFFFYFEFRCKLKFSIKPNCLNFSVMCSSQYIWYKCKKNWDFAGFASHTEMKSNTLPNLCQLEKFWFFWQKSHKVSHEH